MRSRSRREAAVAALVVALTLGVAASSASAAVLTFTPDMGLPSPATLQVSGAGWPPASKVGIRECTGENIIRPADCTAPLAGADTDATGSFGPVAVTVTSTFVGDISGRTIDCALTTCVVWAVNETGTNVFQRTIGFAVPPPGMTATETSPGSPQQPTGRRTAAIRRCKQRLEKGDPKRKRCLTKARKLPA
jgi:hypothetical protein